MCKVIAVANEKGGVAKTTTVCNLGVGLARKGKRVLLVDMDGQGSLSESFGKNVRDFRRVFMADFFGKCINGENFNAADGIMRHEEGVDLILSGRELNRIELFFISVQCGEFMLDMFLRSLRGSYDYILVDCPASLGLLTANAVIAADHIIIPAAAAPLSAEGVRHTVSMAERIGRITRSGAVTVGILMTDVESSTRNARKAIRDIGGMYVWDIGLFRARIPHSARVREAAEAGLSVHALDPDGAASRAYMALAEELLEPGGMDTGLRKAVA